MIEKKELAEKIIQTINPDGKNPQITERTINETLDTLIPFAGEEESIDDFLARIEPIFKTMAGNVRKDVSEFSKKVEENMKKKEVEKKEEKKEEPKNDTPEWAKSLLETVSEFGEWKKQQEAGVKSETTKRGLVENAKKLYPTNVIEVAELGFDFTKDDAEKEFQSRLAVVAGKMGVKPVNTKTDDEPDFSDFKKRLEDRGIIKETKN